MNLLDDFATRRIPFGLLAVAPALLALSAAPPGDLREAVETRLGALYPADEPGAVVLVARGDAVLVQAAFGLADLEHEVPMTVDAVFHLASVAKLFTAAAALQAVQDGLLELDGVLESLPPVEREAGVTVRELLSHTSGVPEYLDRPDARTWIRSELTLDELVASFADRPLDFAPGSRAAYSNSNYVLLAAALERATGKPFETLMEELVFEPAGLRHTRCGGRSEFVPNRALGYELTPDR